MFLPFFENLRQAGLPVSLREYLTFLEAMNRNIVLYDVEGFYYLARSAMVKDERLIDRFDRAFAASFEGLDKISVEVAQMENLTHRLSDSYLDLDLLDQQARDVLGLIRADEIVIR